MIGRPPRSTRICPLSPFTTLFRSSFAILAGPDDGFNHVKFMVSDLGHVGRAINRMKAANVPIVFGPGRHEPSGSIFLYFLDPDGMTAEYSFGMEEFDEVGAREPPELAATPEVLDRSEVRRVGKEWDRTCRSPWSPYNATHNKKSTTL